MDLAVTLCREKSTTGRSGAPGRFRPRELTTCRRTVLFAARCHRVDADRGSACDYAFRRRAAGSETTASGDER